MKENFDIFDTIEIIYPDDWTNSKLLKEAFKLNPLKGFFISCSYNNSHIHRFGNIQISTPKNDNHPHYLGSGLIICTSRMVLIEKFNKNMNEALNKYLQDYQTID